jgi:membrane protein YdbS with pleckstrin-like domain
MAQRPPYGIVDFKEHERIVAVVRHHWFVFFRQIFGILILFLIPFFFIPIIWASLAQTGAPGISGGVVLFFGSLWTLILWNFLFARWTDYYYDIWVITNWRIVDIDQRGLFRRNTATLLTLDHIQDVEAQLEGVFANVLNFGHVQVQTAATQREFSMDDVANPNRVVEIIREALAEKSRVFGAQLTSFH